MNGKVMIVDDEPDILNSLKTLLEKHDYDVITVESGLECIDEIENGFKGVVLMDLMMPDMDGWDTIHEIAERGLMRNVAINIITGKGTKNHERMGALGSYIYDYLCKPLDINELIASIERCFKFFSAKAS
jgi:DNA-binding response OmpR family regulator